MTLVALTVRSRSGPGFGRAQRNAPDQTSAGAPEESDAQRALARRRFRAMPDVVTNGATTSATGFVTPIRAAIFDALCVTLCVTTLVAFCATTFAETVAARFEMFRSVHFFTPRAMFRTALGAASFAALCVGISVGLCATRCAAQTHAQPSAVAPEAKAVAGIAIPAGTILPIELHSTLSPEKSKPGQLVSGRIMQDVPLASGVTIKAGSKVLGRVVAVTPASAGVPPSISLQFDQLISAHQTISITTNLRAIAGFMRIDEAQIPTTGPSESDVYRWLPTTQIGGDAVYGADGQVGSAENADEIIGHSVDGGVLGQVRAKPGTPCRGAIAGNDAPQALWVFSSDACGPYGLAHLSIAHAGRTSPAGVIILASDTAKLKIPGGTGMLLRVNAPTED